jgi:Hint module
LLFSYLSKTGTKVSVPTVGTKTCGQLQSMADDKALFPDECGQIQTVVLKTSDPCGCKEYGGGECESPAFSNNQKCNLCGGDKIIGDSDFIIPAGILTGAACIDVFDDNKYGAFASVCSQAQEIVQKYCKCTTLGKGVKQCIPLESDYCDMDDRCCAGSCKYLKSKGGFRCTERPGDEPPPNSAPGKPSSQCFSGDMKVQVEGIGSVKLQDINIGDNVLTARGKYETVYSFGHRNEYIMADYLQIRLEGKNEVLELSKEHMVFVKEGHAVPAATLKVGDSLQLLSHTSNDESAARIQSLKTVRRQGMYAPFTKSGTIVVNGVLASTFVGLQPTSEYLSLGSDQSAIAIPVSQQWLAHVFETPHRLAYRLGFVKEQYTRNGISIWVNLPFHFSKWLVRQNAMIMIMILIPSIGILSFLWCLEQHMLTTIVALSVILILKGMKRPSKHQGSVNQ